MFVSSMSSTPPVQAIKAQSASFVGDFRGIDWLHMLETWGLKLLAAVVIFIVGRWLSKRLSSALDSAMGRAEVDKTLSGFLRNIAYAVMLVLVLMTALTALGIPTTSMFAVLGAAGLAVGLALKDSLSNIASGVMLIVLRPMRVGDHVVVAGQEGIVLEIRVFQTRIRAFDHRVFFLPNSEITTAPIVNFSTLPLRRMDISVGVGYDDDLQKAREVLLQIAGDEPRIVAEPPAVVRVVNLGESSVDLVLQAFTANADFVPTSSDVVEAVRNRLIEHGLNIPYPQRDVHVYQHVVAGSDATERDRNAIAQAAAAASD